MRALKRQADEVQPDRAAALLRALEGGGLIDARRVAVVVAHPDDEAIGLGGQLARLNGVTVIHVTDGAPRNGTAAAEHGFASAAEYALARACELERAMMLGGVPVADRFCLGLPDQETALHLPRIVRALMRLFEARTIEAVLTHAYEGGHPDHDAVAFAVHAARRLLARAGRTVGIAEMPFYRAGEGEGWIVQGFVPTAGASEMAIALDDEARALKQEMLAAHRTQAATLKMFSTEVERFRVAPDHDFGALPNGGNLLYERHDWGLTGARWSALVAAARAELGLDGHP